MLIASILTTVIAILFFGIPEVSCQTLAATMTNQLGAYSYFNLLLYNNLLPSGQNFTLEIKEITATNYNSTAVRTAVMSTTVTYQLNSSKYTIWNYQSTVKMIMILITTTNTSVTLSSYILSKQETIQPSMLVAILDNDQTSGYMLPFNMQNVKVTKTFVLTHNATLSPRSISLPPYMSTYWTQNKITSSVMPYLPYFSHCSYELNYMMLNDLIMNASCSPNVFENVHCQNKKLSFDCIIEEYQVASISSEYWFNAQNKIVFYLYPEQLSAQQVDNFVINQDLVTSLFDKYYENLVPVRYARMSSHKFIVNKFEIIIRVDINYGDKIQILSAQIIGNYDKKIVQPYANVMVKVEFISLIDSFIYYNRGPGFYVFFAFFVAAVFMVPLRLIHVHLGSIHIGEKFKYMVSPALKGIAYGLLTGGGLTIFVHIISFYSNYSAITATFDADYTGEALSNNNKGRYGLAFILIGSYIVMTGIRQASKVNQTEQLKIALEDDKWEFDSDDQLQEKIQFSKKNQISHRRHVFNGMLFLLIISLYMLLLETEPPNFDLFFHQVFLFPLMAKIIIFFIRKYLIKSYIFLCAIMVSLQLLPIFKILKNQDIYQLVYLYLSKYISNLIVMIYLDVFLDWLSEKIYHKRGEHKGAQFLFKIFEKQIVSSLEESQYQRALSYSIHTVSIITSIFLYPALGLIIYLTEQNNEIPQLLLVTQPSITNAVFLFFPTTIVELYSTLITVDYLKKNFDLRIEETIRFNHFKFMRQKFRWMNDVFAHSKDIRQDYRQYQKFAFSSQLYFVISLIAVGLQVALIGMVTVVKIRYLPFYDPVTIPLLIILWIIIEILSTVVSFAAVKLKLYERKQVDPIRQKLGKIDRYLKIDQTQEHLELAAVKDYFMLYNKNWIIANFDKIFTKEDFRMNNCELISKYKHYKSAFKRQQIALKKKQQIQKLNSAKMNQRGELFEEKYRIIRNQNVFQNTKRIGIYWYYLAKQNLYLKDIVNRVKKQQIKDICEYCKMDVQLEVLEKKQFHSLTNRYRIQNVGKMFDQNAFLQFYRLNQEFITICVDCKQRNLHLESQINSKSKSSKIVFNWLLMARSRLLHKRKMIEEHLI